MDEFERVCEFVRGGESDRDGVADGWVRFRVVRFGLGWLGSVYLN